MAGGLLSCVMGTLSCGMHVVTSSPTRDRTQAPCIGSAVLTTVPGKSLNPYFSLHYLGNELIEIYYLMGHTIHLFIAYYLFEVSLILLAYSLLSKSIFTLAIIINYFICHISTLFSVGFNSVLLICPHMLCPSLIGFFKPGSSIYFLKLLQPQQYILFLGQEKQIQCIDCGPCWVHG